MTYKHHMVQKRETRGGLEYHEKVRPLIILRESSVDFRKESKNSYTKTSENSIPNEATKIQNQ